MYVTQLFYVHRLQVFIKRNLPHLAASPDTQLSYVHRSFSQFQKLLKLLL